VTKRATTRKYNDPKAAASGGGGKSGSARSITTVLVCAASAPTLEFELVAPFTTIEAEVVTDIAELNWLRLRKQRPDIAIIDIGEFGEHALLLCQFIQTELPKTKVMIWSELPHILEAYDRLSAAGIDVMCLNDEPELLFFALYLWCVKRETSIDPHIFQSLLNR
jgi:DNA-binding NarL/FixJ family response regulator